MASGPDGEELLDEDSSNADLAGVTQNRWSSHLCRCQEHMPSILLATCCPCVLYGQVVTRAQIPQCIGTKNSLSNSCRQRSGCKAFIDIWFWTLVLGSLCLGLGLSAVELGFTRSWFQAAGVLLLLFWIYINGHVRMAFKEKYMIPRIIKLQGWCRVGRCLDYFMDLLISVVCLPCSLAQMARHVFMYQSWGEAYGNREDVVFPFFFGGIYIGNPTPSLLPALDTNFTAEQGFSRPTRADNAGGSSWSDHRDGDRAENGGGFYNVGTTNQTADVYVPPINRPKNSINSDSNDQQVPTAYATTASADTSNVPITATLPNAVPVGSNHNVRGETHTVGRPI